MRYLLLLLLAGCAGGDVIYEPEPKRIVRFSCSPGFVLECGYRDGNRACECFPANTGHDQEDY